MQTVKFSFVFCPGKNGISISYVQRELTSAPCVLISRYHLTGMCTGVTFGCLTNEMGVLLEFYLPTA